MNIKLLNFVLIFLLFFPSFSIKASPVSPLEPNDYQVKSAREKQDDLWKRIMDSQYNLNDVSRKVSVFKLMENVLYSAVSPAFLVSSDFKPRKSVKIIHPFGSVAKVDFIITNHNQPYSGFFKEGGFGLARLSLGVASDSVFIPGMAIKMLIDGKPSVNLHVMNSLEGQGKNRNYFAKVFANQYPEPKGGPLKLLAKVFESFLAKMKKNNPGLDLGGSNGYRPIIHLARTNNSGNIIPPNLVKTPYNIFFVPAYNGERFTNDKKDLRWHLDELKQGDVIYKVYVSRPEVRTFESYEKGVEIGKIVLTSKLIASEFGDEILNFQHAL
jgi:hypothetical protein